MCVRGIPHEVELKDTGLQRESSGAHLQRGGDAHRPVETLSLRHELLDGGSCSVIGCG